MRQSSRLFLNVAVTATRMVFTIWIGLMTLRLTFAVLGEVSYGIMAAVGALIAVLPTLMDALAMGGQRHLAWAIGAQDRPAVHAIFSTLFFIYLFGVLAIGALVLPASPWIVGALNLPVGREAESVWVFVCVACTAMLGLIGTPFRSMLVAQQRFVWIAVMDVVMKLGLLAIVTVLQWVPGERLIWYAVANAGLYLAMVLLTVVIVIRQTGGYVPRFGDYSRRHQGELLRFAGWSVLSAIGFQLRFQSQTVILNLGFGTIVNAAFDVGIRLGFYPSQLPSAISAMIAPAVTGLLAQQRQQDAVRLALTASKVTSLTCLAVLIPLVFESSLVVRLVLGAYPAFSPEFTVVVALMLLAVLLSSGNALYLQGRGLIRGLTVNQLLWETVAFGAGCLAVFAFGGGPLSAPVLMLAGVVGWSCIVTPMLSHRAGLPITLWLRSVVCRVAAVTVGPLLACWLVAHWMPPSVLRVVVAFTAAGLATLIGSMLVGLTRPEREQVRRLLTTVMARRHPGDVPLTAEDSKPVGVPGATDRS